MNTPYVIKRNEFGKILNPIEKSYVSEYPNRKQRRKKEPRFYGESKNLHLTIVKNAAFRRVKQIILGINQLGNPIQKKVIHHYLPK